MKTLVLISSLLISLNCFAAGDAKIGATKVGTCAACHGPKGISNNPLWPNLAGQQLDYLIKQMKDFKSGARKDPLMSPQAQIIKDEDIPHIAAYYNSLK